MRKIFLLLSLAVLYASAETPLVIEKVVRVYDGDTFYANLKDVHPLLGHEIGIRVEGVDTPEIRGSSKCVKQMAYAARDFVKNLFNEAKTIELRNCGRGKYFRIIADVYVDGKNLADLLINAGYAKPYSGGTKSEWACEAEDQ